MKLFLDTGSLVALHNVDDEHHAEATAIFHEIASGRARVSKLYCSDYVLDESVATCFARTHNRRSAILLGRSILESESIVLLRIDPDAFNQSWTLFRDKFHDIPLSFTDCTTYILMKLNGIANVFSFDSDFDALGLERTPKG
ncbi:MAG TPA: PIN domain-containing protein [Nitrososphaerales archaeon]|nr:PIN domain-containing protein [Nitrososphaerales archaeon]